MNKTFRRRKVAKAIAMLMAITDVDDLEEMKGWDDLSAEDKEVAKRIAGEIINLVDALFTVS